MSGLPIISVRGAVAVAVCMLLGSVAVGRPAAAGRQAAASDAASDFIGIWQGNDASDGGQITLEITRNPENRKILDLRFNDTFIRACTIPPIPNLPVGDAVDQRRGIYLGQAKAVGKKLVSTGSVPGAGRVTGGVQEIPGGQADQSLSYEGADLVQVQVFCYLASSPGKPFLALSAFWQFRLKGGTLLMTGSLVTDDSSTPNVIETEDGPNSMRFQRISQPER